MFIGVSAGEPTIMEGPHFARTRQIRAHGPHFAAKLQDVQIIFFFFTHFGFCTLKVCSY